MTLRQGNAIDSHRDDNELAGGAGDEPTDQYLEQYHWGVPYLDAHSWRCYLPYLISYAVRHMHDGSSLVINALLNSLRPPDREPSRLATLANDQEKVIVATLELLGFDKASDHQAFALQVMEEYWIPNAIFRNAGRAAHLKLNA